MPPGEAAVPCHRSPDFHPPGLVLGYAASSPTEIADGVALLGGLL